MANHFFEGLLSRATLPSDGAFYDVLGHSHNTVSWTQCWSGLGEWHPTGGSSKGEPRIPGKRMGRIQRRNIGLA